MKLLRSLITLALPAGLALAAFAASGLDLPRALPADTALVLHLSDFPTLRANWEHTPMAKTWAEPDVQKFFAPLIEKFNSGEGGKAIDELRKTTGMELKEILDLFPGEVAVALLDLKPLMQGQGEHNKQVVVLAEIGGNRTKIEELRRKGLESTGETEVTEEFQGETLHCVMKKNSETGELTPSESWVIVGETFILAEPKEALQRVVALLKQGGDSLATVEEFASLYARQPKCGLALFANGEAIIPGVIEIVQAATATSEQGAFAGLSAVDLIRHLGGDTVRSVSFTASVLREETTTEFRVSWRETRGIWRWLAVGAPPVTLPAEIPESWVGAAVMRFSFPQMYHAFMESLRTATPAIEQKARQQIQGLNQYLKIDLERDLIGSIGDDVYSGEALNLDADGKPSVANPTHQLIGIGLKDSATFDRTLETLKGMAPPLQQMIKTREYLGERIHVFTPPMPPPEMRKPGQAVPPTIAYSVTRTHLLLAIGDDRMIEGVLQTRAGNGRSFWKKPEVVEAIEHLPPGYVGVSAYDTGRVVSMLFDVATNAQQMMSAGAQADGDDSAAKNAFVDPSARPNAEAIARHWKTYATGSYMEPNAIRSISQIKHSE